MIGILNIILYPVMCDTILVIIRTCAIQILFIYFKQEILTIHHFEIMILSFYMAGHNKNYIMLDLEL